MDNLLLLNIIGAALLGAQAFVLLALVIHRSEPAYRVAFFLCWGIYQVINIIFYVFRILPNYPPNSICVPLDTVANVFPLLAAYSLFSQDKFTWRLIFVGAALIPAPAILFTLPYVLSSPNSELWKLICVAPNLLMAQAGLLAVGIGIFIEPTTRSVRVPLLIIFFVYAVLQLPSYMFSVVDDVPNRCWEAIPQASNCEAVQIIRTYNGVAKIVLFCSFIIIALSAAKVATTKSFVRGMQLIMWLLSIGLTALIYILKAEKLVSALARSSSFAQ
jgi:hypothetical protein